VRFSIFPEFQFRRIIDAGRSLVAMSSIGKIFEEPLMADCRTPQEHFTHHLNGRYEGESRIRSPTFCQAQFKFPHLI
jgi:hypothetical protein